MMSESILKLIKPADIITLLNALLGFASILMVMNGQIDSALILIILAVVADGADGAVARITGGGVLGANLDSLSDAISFGAAPAVVSFYFLKETGYLAWFAAGLFLACGILRLARFNVSGKKEGFEGIPITSGGFIVALFLLMRDYVPFLELSLAALLVISSLLMVSTISYPKMKNPLVLALPGILLFLDIAAFYLGYPDVVNTVSLILFLFICLYIISPVGREFYGRSN